MESVMPDQVKQLTFAYDYTDVACQYVKQQMSDKFTRIKDVDCLALADKVNGYWINTKEMMELSITSGKVFIEFIAEIPWLIVTGYDLIGTVPILGQWLQIGVFCLGTYVVLDLIKGPEKHVFIPKEMYEEYMLGPIKPLSYYLETDPTLEADLIKASRERLKQGDIMKEITLRDGRSILEIPASAYRRVLEAHKIPIQVKPKEPPVGAKVPLIAT